MSDIRRREFAALVGGAALLLAARVGRARAQQPAGRLRHIGLLHPGTPPNPNVEAFKQGLRDLGYVDGQNVVIEYRWAEGMLDPLRSFAAELVRLNVDLIVTEGLPSARALKKATNTIPIVVARAGDLVGSGLVGSLARPGGNVTGFTLYEYGLAAKWLELLKEIAPSVRQVAVLRDAGLSVGVGQFGAMQSVAPSFGVELRPIDVRDAPEIERAITAFARSANGGLVVTGSALAVTHRETIAALAARHKLPAVYSGRFYVTAGGLLSYGPDFVDQFRQAAGYVDRILKGEKPAELAVQEPTKFELVINLKTAKALGLEVPPMLLARADEVIE